MIDTKTTVFVDTEDGEIFGIFKLSEEQRRLLDWLNSNGLLYSELDYETYDSVEDM